MCGKYLIKVLINYVRHMHMKIMQLETLFFHLVGPDVKGSVERKELLHSELWELSTCLVNHLKIRGSMVYI